eukprot:Rhum_TRINITY_DN25535_c0_g1::Rhum_TRINITY_DN25535_c0_g1_i1::g.182258::m.182258
MWRTPVRHNAFNHVAKDMVRVWRQYGHRVGEVHATIHGLHWSVNDEMLKAYLEQYAVTRECLVERDRLSRSRARDPQRRFGKSLGTGQVVFQAGQEAALARLFRTRHVLNGREMMLTPADKQPEFNFYLPNTHEDQAEGMDPSALSKMSNQVMNLHVTVTGKFANPKLRALQRFRDLGRNKKFKVGKEQPPNPDKPWFYDMGEAQWEDEQQKFQGAGDGAQYGRPDYDKEDATSREPPRHSGQRSKRVGRSQDYYQNHKSPVKDFLKRELAEATRGVDRVHREDESQRGDSTFKQEFGPIQ